MKNYIGIINSIEMEYYGRVGDIVIVEIDENFLTVCTISRPLDRKYWNESGHIRTVGCVTNVPIEYIKIIHTNKIKQLLQYVTP